MQSEASSTGSSDGNERRAFLAQLQHDLRTPAAAIVGYSELLAAEFPQAPEVEPELIKLLGTGEALIRAIDGLLTRPDVDEHTERPADGAHIYNELSAYLQSILGSAEALVASLNAAEDDALHASLQIIHCCQELAITAGEVGARLAAGPLQGEMPGKKVDSRLARSVVKTLRTSGSTAEAEGATVLLADDDSASRDLMTRRLRRWGCKVDVACDGLEALVKLQAGQYDLVLLDIIMPSMNGYEVLEALRDDDVLKHTPVLVMSAFDDVDSITRCVQLGADDYLPKGTNAELISARITASLDRKRLRDREQLYLEQLNLERERSDALLNSILPSSIAARLKAGEEVIANSFGAATVLFADIVGFTHFSASQSPEAVVSQLNELFMTFDEVVARHGGEKIKTIGDAYMAAAGLPVACDDHADIVASVALDMLLAFDDHRRRDNAFEALRIGIHSGPVAAGVLGKSRFMYDLWGDTVNVASRMQSMAFPGTIQISAETHTRLRERFVTRERGVVQVKGRGPMQTFWLEAGRPDV